MKRRAIRVGNLYRRRRQRDAIARGNTLHMFSLHLRLLGEDWSTVRASGLRQGLRLLQGFPRSPKQQQIKVSTRVRVFLYLPVFNIRAP